MKLGHQKRFLLAIKKIKEIGMNNTREQHHHQQQQPMLSSFQQQRRQRQQQQQQQQQQLYNPAVIQLHQQHQQQPVMPRSHVTLDDSHLMTFTNPVTVEPLRATGTLPRQKPVAKVAAIVQPQVRRLNV